MATRALISSVLSALVLVTLVGCEDPGPEFLDAGTDAMPDADLTAPDTSLTVSPSALSNQALARFEFTGVGAASFRCKLDDGLEAACASPFEVTVGEGEHRFEVVAVSAAGVVDLTPATHSWRVDLTPPDTTITEAPGALDNSVMVDFEFAAQEEVTSTCALDGAAAVACTSPHRVTGLTDGPHTFVVTATDLAGNAELQPARHAWTVDTSAPDTTIVTGPTGSVATTAATFTFSSPDAGAGATFECALDTAAFAACTSPRALTNLAQGAHTFQVRVRDATGNLDPSPARRTWTVDTIAPTATITSGPTGPISDSTPTFGFTTAGAPTLIQCRVYAGAPAGAYTACTTTYTPPALTDGAYTFEVRVADAAANASSATRTFSVDTAAPTVTITGGPTGATNDNTPTFTFTTAGAPTATECRIGAGAFVACAASYTPAALAEGAATFEVRVTDAAGNTSSASRAFSVDTQGPTVTITGGPTGATNDNTPTFTFTTAGAPATTQCRVGAGTFVACAGTYTPAALVDGGHTFEVQVVDTAGNSNNATRAFSVDTVLPTVTITAGPAGATNDSTPTFSFTTGGTPTTTQCRIGGAFVACAASYTPAALVDGAYTFEVQVIDAAGNSASATRGFSVDTVGPTVTITAGPTGATNDSTPTFTFTTGGSPAATQCRIGGAFVACAASYTPAALADGAYTFEVQVIDGAGNSASATRGFSVDTVGPTVSITGGPGGPQGGWATDSTPTFTFAVAGAPTVTQCRIGGTFVACAGSYTPANALADGSYTFEVQVIDGAGNSASATRLFTLDTVGPTVTITGGPGPLTNDNTPTWTFTTGGSPATTLCRIGTGNFVACSQSYTTPAGTALTDGSWTFEVQVADAAGNTASATRTITVDTQAPTVTITAGPGGPNGGWTNDNTPTWTFTYTGNPTAVTCRINQGQLAGTSIACPGGNFTSATLNDAPDYAFDVTVVDQAGNASQASRTFWVDATPPNVTVTSGPQSSALSQEVFTFTSSSPGAPIQSRQCRHYPRGFPGGNYINCASPQTWNMPLTPAGQNGAEWTFEVRIIDAAGNQRSAFWNFGTYIIT